jgi:DNA-binding NarL/FixJ family response regulator
MLWSERGAAITAIEAGLPGILAEIADATDRETALKLASAVGGEDFYLPDIVTDNTRLAQVLGLEAAKKIRAAVGYGRVTIPTCRSLRRVERHSKIKRLIELGLSNRMIARSEKIHTRTVSRIRSAMRREAAR